MERSITRSESVATENATTDWSCERALFDPQMVKLNVGGRKYATTESTLKSKGSNFFSAMLDNIREGTMKCVKDTENHIFIDRNGVVFGAVLEYLRTGKLFVPPGVSLEQVQVEFDFYNIDMPMPESFKLAMNAKWRSLAISFFQRYWSDIHDKLEEMVEEHGLNSCTLTIIDDCRFSGNDTSSTNNSNSNNDEEREPAVQRYYNNIRVSIDSNIFSPPFKPLFLDNILFILQQEYQFECYYVNRQQTVDITLSWSLGGSGPNGNGGAAGNHKIKSRDFDC